MCVCVCVYVCTDATAYQSLVPQWSKQGVEVVQVYSGDDKKYVQVRHAHPHTHTHTHTHTHARRRPCTNTSLGIHMIASLKKPGTHLHS